MYFRRWLDQSLDALRSAADRARPLRPPLSRPQPVAAQQRRCRSARRASSARSRAAPLVGEMDARRRCAAGCARRSARRQKSVTTLAQPGSSKASELLARAHRRAAARRRPRPADVAHHERRPARPRSAANPGGAHEVVPQRSARHDQPAAAQTISGIARSVSSPEPAASSRRATPRRAVAARRVDDALDGVLDTHHVGSNSSMLERAFYNACHTTNADPLNRHDPRRGPRRAARRQLDRGSRPSRRPRRQRRTHRHHHHRFGSAIACSSRPASRPSAPGWIPSSCLHGLRRPVTSTTAVAAEVQPRPGRAARAGRRRAS